VTHHRANNSHKQPNKSVGRVNLKTLAHRIGVNEAPLRCWLRVRFGRRRRPWLFTEKRAEKTIAEYWEDRR
jgi:hypothetical protein